MLVFILSELSRSQSCFCKVVCASMSIGARPTAGQLDLREHHLGFGIYEQLQDANESKA